MPAHRGLGSETSQTLERGLAILEMLGTRGQAGGMTVTELATALGVGRPVVYRLLATLEQRSFVTRRADGRLRLGLAVAQLTSAVLPLLRDSAVPALHTLADTVGATAHLTVADGGEALALAVVEPSWTQLHVAYRAGSRHPLDRGAAGRAILAGRNQEAGYVTSAGELQPGAHGIAAPAFGVDGVEASVGVVSLAPLDAERVGPQVVAAARAVATALH